MSRWWRVTGTWVALASLQAAVAAAQRPEPRSRDYLFVTSVDDARAAWVNPAGLGWIPEASVMAELVTDRSTGSLRLSQYTLGLNSRGLGLAYERDRSRPNFSVGVVRIGLGLPLGTGSIGAAMSSYRGTRDAGYDLGLRYPVFAGLDVGLVVRNLGRPQPVLAESPERVVTVAGATWTVAPRLANVSAEAIAVERPGAVSGFDISYRGGFVLRSIKPWPIALHAVAQLGSDGAFQRWSLGVVVGGLDRVALVTGAAPTTGLGAPQQFSGTGVASRRPPALAPSP